MRTAEERLDQQDSPLHSDSVFSLSFTHKHSIKLANLMPALILEASLGLEKKEEYCCELNLF